MLVITIILAPLDKGGFIARGIIQDVTVFEHVHFANANEFARYAAKHWTNKYITRICWTGVKKGAA